jgi:hypothetical protein
VSTLNTWLHRHPEWSARVSAAIRDSAEAIADRGYQELAQATSSMAEISRARAMEQHWRWRAAIRNPQYRERIDHAHQGTVTHAVEQMSRQQLEQIAAQGLPLVERVDDASETPGGGGLSGVVGG